MEKLTILPISMLNALITKLKLNNIPVNYPTTQASEDIATNGDTFYIGKGTSENCCRTLKKRYHDTY
jgi:hypothetical protein